MTSRTAAIIFRLFFAALALFAVGAQLFTRHLPAGYDVVNFFSYFTNLSNIFISVVFIVSASRLIRGRTESSAMDAAIRGASVVYIVFVGLVFNTLLVGADLGDLMPWVNIVCHFVMPIVGLIDWLIWPPRRRIPLSTALWWLSFPAIYVAYTLVRGAILNWYPYPFFNPAVSGGYGGVALYCAGMLVGFLVLALLIRWLGNVLGARRDARVASER
jgi:hypothetical protein